MARFILLYRVGGLQRLYILHVGKDARRIARIKAEQGGAGMTVKIQYIGQETKYNVRIEQESIDNVVACLLDDVSVKVEVQE